ncbi:MAG: hypothetical protein R3C15_07460 [Thermoleophilia bacterium]
MSRIPIRAQVAVAFACALALVLAATGAFVYLRLGSDLAQALDRELRQRADDLRALVEQGSGTLARTPGVLVERGESFAQLLDPAGAVIDTSATLGPTPLLAGEQLAMRCASRPSSTGMPSPASTSRPYCSPFPSSRRGVGSSSWSAPPARIATRRSPISAPNSDRRPHRAGPGDGVPATLFAGAGLAAVEAMRRRAAAISADRPGERLPVPPTRDELERLGHT